MSTYEIRQEAATPTVPPLFTDLMTFIGAQPHGSLGWFDTFGPGEIPPQWEPAAAERLNTHGFSFLELADGSMVALLHTGVTGAPPAVVFLGSEGEHHTIANSLEEFLVLWSKGETAVHDLDDEEIEGRAALAAWIKGRKIKIPKAADFDFGAWLAGETTSVPPAAAVAHRQPTAEYEKLGPNVRKLVDMMGRRADDEALIDWITNTLGKKVPRHTSSDSVNVSAPKAGIEMVFSHNVRNEKYPPISKSARSFIPYLSHAWIREKIGEPVFGVDVKKGTEADVIKSLGDPDGYEPAFMSDNDPTVAYWHRVVDAAADVVLEIESDDGLGFVVTIVSSRALEEYPGVSTHLFLGWAATRGLLDETYFAQHADLLAKVKGRQALGSDLLRAALPRGLWDSHLVDKPGLRRTAYQWFHNMAGLWITADLIKIFGSHRGPFGHDDPTVDNDSWENVDKAAPAFEKVFAKWL
jgi:hypothetical protein